MTYSLGGFAVVLAWIVDPRVISNRVGMAALLSVVFVFAIVIYVLRQHLPSYAGDVAIVGSLVLIDVALFFTNLHQYPALLSPFFVWVGFASPLWFPRRRAVLYALLAVIASGIVVLVGDTSALVAGWFITMATVVVAFTITEFLTDSLVARERLAVVGEMASIVGHDLRNPLGAVSNAVFLVRFSLGDMATDDQVRHLDMAEREIAKASGIIEHLSSFVRPSDPVFSPVDLEDLVAEVIEVTPAPENVELSVEVPPITLYADAGQLARILTNLVSNAYDALSEGGSLSIVGSTDGGMVQIVVHDSGPGIDRASAERIFEPFFTTKHRGTGLGLAIVLRLVESHGGSVSLDSDPSTGTSFTIRLPAWST